MRPLQSQRTSLAGPRGGKADATDLKSVDRKVVRVRFPPGALSFMQQPTRISNDGSRHIGKRLLVGISYEDDEAAAKYERTGGRRGVMDSRAGRVAGLVALALYRHARLRMWTP